MAPSLTEVGARARGRIARRLLPYLFILYVIAFLDRVNVAYAALGMTGDLGFSPEVFGFGAGIFFIGYFLLEIPGAPLAGIILGMNWAGLPGWRWIFFLEGVPAILFGVITIFYLTDRPQQAHWLPSDERDWIIAELEREKREKNARRQFTIGEALRHRHVVLLAAVYFLAVTGSYGVSFWLPTILKQLSGLSNLTVALIAAAPYVLLLFTMILVGWSSDRRNERRWHTAVPLLIAGGALGASVAARSHLVAAILLLTVATGFLWTFAPIFWALPTSILTEGAAAASIGLINSVGNLGGFAGPYAVGYLEQLTGSTSAGIVCLAASLALAAILVLRLHKPGTADQ